jgi:hypothetical protein
MSTRCQVKVVQEGTEWKQEVSLYHHTDGYPDYMIGVIRKAKAQYGLGWEGGRAGKVASALCAIDPMVFEPEDSHTLHGDIEFYYILKVQNQSGGSMAEIPNWEVEIYEPKKGFWKLKKPTLKHLELKTKISI